MKEEFEDIPAWWKYEGDIPAGVCTAFAALFTGRLWYAPYKVRPVPSGYGAAFEDWAPMVEQFWAEREGLA